MYIEIKSPAASPGVEQVVADALREDPRWARLVAAGKVEVLGFDAVGFADAALGGELEVPTLDGRVKLKIPEGTQTGKLFRLRGKGVKSVRSRVPGDLYCKVVVETPVNLTAEQREGITASLTAGDVAALTQALGQALAAAFGETPEPPEPDPR